VFVRETCQLVGECPDGHFIFDEVERFMCHEWKGAMDARVLRDALRAGQVPTHLAEALAARMLNTNPKRLRQLMRRPRKRAPPASASSAKQMG
jgi:hypothetical protein